MEYIRIIAKDRKGLLTEVSELVGRHDINIDAINALSEKGYAQIKLATADNDRALSVLNEAGFKGVPDDNILVGIKDTPGELGRISRQLSENDIDIRAITMIEQNQGINIVAIVTDRDAKAKEILDDILVK
ncbi:MAG TPA: hypothetical protein DHV36_25310 [Desulfobacteraceae bacterium]|nr:hypothetical protein [Desulfobacteraceae bacterium]